MVGGLIKWREKNELSSIHALIKFYAQYRGNIANYYDTAAV